MLYTPKPFLCAPIGGASPIPVNERPITSVPRIDAKIRDGLTNCIAITEQYVAREGGIGVPNVRTYYRPKAQ